LTQRKYVYILLFIMTEPDLAQCNLVANTCLNAHLRRTMRAISQLYDAAIRPSGLRGSQMTILVALALAGSVTINDLANELVMDRTTLSRNLKPLERDGFVLVEPGDDQRQRVITLTETGKQKLAQALPLWQEAQTKVMVGFTAARFDGLLADLETAVALSQVE